MQLNAYFTLIATTLLANHHNLVSETYLSLPTSGPLIFHYVMNMKFLKLSRNSINPKPQDVTEFL